MKSYKVTLKAASGVLVYEVRKTLKGAQGFAKRIASEAFYGESVEVTIVEC
jgi:hypothetical protein